ncbi:TPA: toxin-antitoxin system HicB family antitoxin [Clostridioides difficile]|uniref:toxin-antitoxin system HicB family antitoxin n=1 Tax=Clostridioides difficile TaxID=1496 RepID=UPI0002D8BBCF|nr:toxin-antitoxin system HicB family antitoxin [Clostridioides difficile]AXU82732.1 Ribbon-helix-helix protein, copG family [Clostridioides difficile]EQJ20815.1 ribbon-helix-helix, copG family protein [Clostridioides difficile P13]EQJ81356.1 ribbon-helix-helix, copG family protein [Clostridioides difficile P46]ERM43587.1 ribbon-helix-helix, copG family protein [Clostridioides difficile P68]MCB4239164.1 toxin-antitoxin system HicB family antitoxin [Clostridioides difficile]
MTAKKRVTIRIPDELNEELHRQSQRKGLSKNAFIINILWKEFEDLQDLKNEQEVDKYE